MKIKSKSILQIIFILFTFLLLLFANSNISAAKYGLELWANNVVPSLQPFFIATELLGYTNFVNILGQFFEVIMRTFI